jgi:hypothetical protein
MELCGWCIIKYEPLRGEGTTALDSCCESHRAEQYCIFHCHSMVAMITAFSSSPVMTLGGLFQSAAHYLCACFSLR